MVFRSLAALLFLLSAQTFAEKIQFESGVARTTLIELYTSEGCSSCPPAEAWLNAYTERETLWTQVVPVAFHVDYWNYLGWTDPFAQPAHAQRQKRYAQLHRASTVYTPAFFVNGSGWRPGVFSQAPPRAGQPVGNLRVVVDGTQVEADFDPVAPMPNDVRLHIAVLGMGLTSVITAGENRGRQSRHEFVVLVHRESLADGRSWRLQLPSLTGVSPSHYALAAWLSAGDDPTPLQAVGGYLPARTAME